MNRPVQPDPYQPTDAETSPDPARPKAAGGSRWWALVAGLLLVAAAVLFVLDRLGVRLPGQQPQQVAAPTVAEVAGTQAPANGPTPKPAPSFLDQQAQIQALVGQVQTLPSLAQAPSLKKPAPTPQNAPATEPARPSQPPGGSSSAESAGAPVTKPDPLVGPSIWARLSEGLSELFIIRRVSPTAQPMLDEAGDRLARQELRLLLLSARMSLMMSQPSQARADLAAAQQLLPMFFRTEDAAVQAFHEQMTTVLSSLPNTP